MATRTLKDRFGFMRSQAASTRVERTQREIRNLQYSSLDVFLAQNPLAQEAYSNQDAEAYEQISRLVRDKIKDPRKLQEIDPFYDKQILEGIASLRELGYTSIPEGIENELTTAGRLLYVSKETTNARRTGTLLSVIATASAPVYLTSATKAISENPLFAKLDLTPETLTFLGAILAGAGIYKFTKNTFLASMATDFETSLDLVHQEACKANDMIRSWKQRREAARFL